MPSARRSGADPGPVRTAWAAAAFLAALLWGVAGLAGAEPPGRFRDPALLRLWQGWVDEAVAESLRTGKPVVIVDKLGRRCLLVTGGKVVDRYEVEMGGNALADKLYEGDEATPEGLYKVTEKRDRGQTLFYRALMLDYPTEEDRREHAEARRQGLVPRGRGPGGLIEMHGMGGRGFDWTLGCVALANGDMDRLFAAVSVGTRIVIVGTARVPGDA
jgi:murein L,D-transpeptidase YafK